MTKNEEQVLARFMASALSGLLANSGVTNLDEDVFKYTEWYTVRARALALDLLGEYQEWVKDI